MFVITLLYHGNTLDSTAVWLHLPPDVRFQGLNNLQSTFQGFGMVNGENVFKVRTIILHTMCSCLFTKFVLQSLLFYLFGSLNQNVVIYNMIDINE